MASIIAVENETRGISSRLTKSGRKITYEMNVVQQPERARACGQGAKSSTDRRPVDPPPIVDLRVFEGEDGNRRDITCAWNANFFLFASLEQARPIAQGRVPPAVNSAPILTGTPVAGMSYLERPQPAVYFIFPDLSVRHEGKYRLSFQLFEELRDPDDRDAIEPTSAGGIGESYYGRCQVKSVPFTVYSAKKFPGLAESTHLSRMVADQGCRVRIRRDVRMRRRDNKDSKDWDEYEEKPAGDQTRRTPSPEPQTQVAIASPDVPHHDQMDTSRSSTNASYNTADDRRKSSQDNNPQYQQYQHPYPQQAPLPPPPPPAPPVPQAPQHAYPHQYDHAAMTPYHQQYIQQQQMVQSPQNMQPPQQYAYGYPPQPMVQYSPGYYMPYQQQPAPPQPHQPQQAMYDQQMSPVRYDNMGYGPPPPPPPQYASGAIPQPPPQYTQQSQMQAPLGPMGHGYGRTMPPQSPSYTNQAPQTSTQPAIGKDLPPLKALETYPGKYEAPSPSVGIPNDRPQAYHGYQEPLVPPPPQYVTSGPTNTKRAFGVVFNTQHVDQPMRAGVRPNTSNGVQDMAMASAYDDGAASDDDSMEIESLKMQYRRADGTHVSRRWPAIRP